jgi:flagellar biosynthesis protein FlhB
VPRRLLSKELSFPAGHRKIVIVGKEVLGAWVLIRFCLQVWAVVTQVCLLSPNSSKINTLTGISAVFSCKLCFNLFKFIFTIYVSSLDFFPAPLHYYRLVLFQTHDVWQKGKKCHDIFIDSLLFFSLPLPFPSIFSLSLNARQITKNRIGMNYKISPSLTAMTSGRNYLSIFHISVLSVK